MKELLQDIKCFLGIHNYREGNMIVETKIYLRPAFSQVTLQYCQHCGIVKVKQ